MKFCKNCGQELRPGVKVCTNCGMPTDESPKENNGRRVNEKRNQGPPPPPKPMDPEKKYWIIGGSIVGAIILLIAIFLILRSMASPISKIDAIEKAVTSKNVDGFKDSIDTKISTDEAKGYIKYIDEEVGFNQYKNDMNEFKSQIIHNVPSPKLYNGTNELLSIEKKGKKFLFFDNYELVIPKKNIKFGEDNDIKEFKYEYDGKKVTWKNGDKFQELIPGIYSFLGKGVLRNDKEVKSTLDISFDPDYESPLVTLVGDYYYIGLHHDYWLNDINKAIDEMKFQLNGKDIDLTPEFEDKYGPLQYDEEYELTGELNLYGQKIAMKPVRFSMSEEDIKNHKNNFDDYENRAEFEIEFNEDKLDQAVENQDKKEQAESNYKYFKENARDEVESFVTSYLYALERMYDDYDIGEVEDYIEKGGNVEGILQSNIDARAFGNMFIYNIKASNFVEDGDTYSIDIKSKRDHDDIDGTSTFHTRYEVEYLKDEGKLVIKNFIDL